MTTADSNRRHFQRITFMGEVTLQQGDRLWPAELVDLSLNGLLVKDPADWDLDQSQAITAHIALSPDTSIAFIAHWRHSRQGMTGFECTGIDIDSIGHLRRLVELNLGDTALLERELEALGQSST